MPRLLLLSLLLVIWEPLAPSQLPGPLYSGRRGMRSAQAFDGLSTLRVLRARVLTRPVAM